MKKQLISWMSIGVVVVSLASCSQNTVLADMSTKDIQDKVSAGSSWQVEQFTDDSKDYTSTFTGWTFEFVKGGNLLVDDNYGKTYTGTWFIDEDDTPGHSDFVISIAGTSGLLEMSEDWSMEEISKNRIALFDEDKGIRTEVLVFTN